MAPTNAINNTDAGPTHPTQASKDSAMSKIKDSQSLLSQLLLDHCLGRVSTTHKPLFKFVQGINSMTGHRNTRGRYWVGSGSFSALDITKEFKSKQHRSLLDARTDLNLQVVDFLKSTEVREAFMRATRQGYSILNMSDPFNDNDLHDFISEHHKKLDRDLDHGQECKLIAIMVGMFSMNMRSHSIAFGTHIATCFDKYLHLAKVPIFLAKGFAYHFAAAAICEIQSESAPQHQAISCLLAKTSRALPAWNGPAYVLKPLERQAAEFVARRGIQSLRLLSNEPKVPWKERLGRSLGRAIAAQLKDITELQALSFICTIWAVLNKLLDHRERSRCMHIVAAVEALGMEMMRPRMPKGIRWPPVGTTNKRKAPCEEMDFCRHYVNARSSKRRKGEFITQYGFRRTYAIPTRGQDSGSL